MPKFVPAKYYGMFRIVPTEDLKYKIQYKRYGFLFANWYDLLNYEDFIEGNLDKFDNIVEAITGIDEEIERLKKVQQHMSQEKVYIYP